MNPVDIQRYRSVVTEIGNPQGILLVQGSADADRITGDLQRGRLVLSRVQRCNIV